MYIITKIETLRIMPSCEQPISLDLISFVTPAIEELVDNLCSGPLNSRGVLLILFVTTNALPAALVVAAAEFGIVVAFFGILIAPAVHTVRLAKDFADE